MEVSLEKGELAQALQVEPKLEPELNLIWEAFAFTTKSRTHTQRTGGEGRIFTLADPIDFKDVVCFCDASGVLCTEQRFRIIRAVQAMDDAYLKAVNPKVK